MIGKIKEIIKGFDRELFRLQSRKKAFEIAKYLFTHYSIVFYILGLLALFVLPYKPVHDNAVVDEKALLVGQVIKYFKSEHMNSKLPNALWDEQVDSHFRASEIQQTLDSLGLDTSLQRFSFLQDDTWINGTNTHGILRSPRGEGTEAIVITAPQRVANGQFNQNGIDVLLSFASFCTKFSFWSKDIIFMISDQDYVGTHFWLEAYHGERSKSFYISYDPLKNHAGSIMSVLNLEFGGSGKYSAIGLHPIGVNGRLPNADLVTSAGLSYLYSGVPMIINEDGQQVEDNEPLMDYYKKSVWNLLSFLKTQALGFPKYQHSLFSRYNIEAITLSGVSIEGEYEYVDTVHIAMGLETICRSLNNLLERFHHAYWFYYMPSANSFIPLSKYIGPLTIIISAAIFKSLELWWNTGTIPYVIPKGYKRQSWRFLQKGFGESNFSSLIRPLYMPFLTIIFCSMFSVQIFYLMDTIRFAAQNQFQSALFMLFATVMSQQMMALFMIPLLQRLYCGEAGASRVTTAPVWKILKCMINGGLGLFLLSVAAMNPSLALVMAILLVPSFIMIRPTKSLIFYSFQMFVLFIISPPVILAIYGLVYGDYTVATQFLSDIWHHWSLFGGLLLPWICLGYWPLTLAAQVLVTMEL
ncbi:Gaa1-like protein [Globomyces pollinis-pini]|nr:Gaa1-like protein [Globomyces pollinis-pini]